MRATPYLRGGILMIVVATILAGCAQSLSKFYPEIIPKKSVTVVPVGKSTKHSLNVTYLGCGSMVLEQDGDAVFTDPFFSTQKLLKVLGKVKTRTDLYEHWKSTLQSHTSRSAVRATLVSHTHYDHVMDLPTILQTHYFTRMETAYGGETLPKMLQNFTKEGVRIEALNETQTVARGGNDNTYEWITVTPHIRFLPIETTHAPQTRNKLSMKGPLDEEYFKKHLVWPGDKIKTTKWTVGTSFAFLVDFIQDDTLRVFIQTSASQFPDGRPPAAELKKKPVDIAILCYASGLNVDDYPGAFVRELNPKKLMFVHWEDFFRESKSEDDVKLVRKTNPKKFRKRIDALGKKKDFFIMPKPGTKITFTY